MKGRIQAAAGIVIEHAEAAPRVKSRVEGGNHYKVSPVKNLVRGAKLATNHNKAAPRLKRGLRGAKIIANRDRALARVGRPGARALGGPRR